VKSFENMFDVDYNFWEFSRFLDIFQFSRAKSAFLEAYKICKMFVFRSTYKFLLELLDA